MEAMSAKDVVSLGAKVAGRAFPPSVIDLTAYMRSRRARVERAGRDSERKVLEMSIEEMDLSGRQVTTASSARVSTPSRI
ncbi:MAG: hypothetical protein V8T45_08870 [Oscillospiraceae bacterium]